MRIVDYEGRPNWRDIVLSVTCMTCYANKGEMCIERLGGTPRSRVDYHASRKQAAIAAWEQKGRDELEELKRIEHVDEKIEKDLDQLIHLLTPKAQSATLILKEN